MQVRRTWAKGMSEGRKTASSFRLVRMACSGLQASFGLSPCLAAAVFTSGTDGLKAISGPGHVTTVMWWWTRVFPWHVHTVAPSNGAVDMLSYTSSMPRPQHPGLATSLKRRWRTSTSTCAARWRWIRASRPAASLIAFCSRWLDLRDVKVGVTCVLNDHCLSHTRLRHTACSSRTGPHTSAYLGCVSS